MVKRKHSWLLSGLLLLMVLSVRGHTEVTVSGMGSERAWEHPRQPITNLSGAICAMYLLSDDKPKGVIRAIKTWLKDNVGMQDPTNEEIISFLNAHKHELTCYGDHFMSFAIKRGLYHQIFYNLFFAESTGFYSEDYKLDFNAVAQTYNPKTDRFEYMTILDYIEKVALVENRSYNTKSELEEMAEIIIDEFDAKRFSELPLSEREAAKAKLRDR